VKDKAVIFDIDGTTIDSPLQKDPSERLVKAVRAIENVYYVCAATGRGWSSAKRVLQGLSLVDPCIISAGTQICDPINGNILWQCDFELGAINKVLEVARQYPEYKVIYNDSEEDEYLYGGLDAAHLKIVEAVYVFELIFIPQAIAPEIVAKLSEIEGIAATLVVAQRKGFNDIHVTNHKATKEHAVVELLTRLGVEKKNTIGIGDGHNDMHLFNAVNHKVAMGNAVDELKAAAHEVIGTVEADGFASFLEQLA
jgi:HAD superfamily hydrolase (TIGR01484 family)